MKSNGHLAGNRVQEIGTLISFVEILSQPCYLKYNFKNQIFKRTAGYED